MADTQAATGASGAGARRGIGRTLRDGSWLTPARARAYPRLVGGIVILALAGLVATSHGGFDWMGRPLGTDFSGVWVAGREVLAGHPAMPYDNAAHAAAQAAAFGASDTYLPWPYPPFALALAAGLATLPYLAALALWQGATLLLYLAAVRRCLAGVRLDGRDMVVAALAFPAVAINLLHGQNGFLSAALIAAGVLALPRRPAVAGVLLGLLAYKPQLALAVPVALVAGRHWRALAAAGATVAAMAAATLLAFGFEPWLGFVRNLGFARRVILEMGGLESFKLQSAFGAARLLGAPLPLAYAAQAAVGGAALAGLAWLWWGRHDLRLKLAGLALASLLTTPYAVDYDLVILGPVLAALTAVIVERGFPPWAKTLLATAWAMPLVARALARAAYVPIGLATMVALLALVLVVARRCAEGAPEKRDALPEPVSFLSRSVA